MAKGIWKTTFIGGFVAWLWMLISWMVLPWHCNVMESFPNEKAAVEAISAQTRASGIYTSPSMCSGQMMEGNTRIFLSISRNNETGGMWIPMIISLVIYFIGGLLVALVIMQMASNSYGKKLFSTAMIGLIIGCMSMLPAWNWWGIPFNYAFLMIIDNFIAWLLAGLVIGAFIHPKGSHKTPSL